MIESRFLFYPQRRLDESRRFFFRSREEDEEDEEEEDDDDDEDDDDPEDDDDDPDDDVYAPDVLELALPLSLPDELELDELDELGDLRLFLFFFPNAALNRRSIASPSGTSSPSKLLARKLLFQPRISQPRARARASHVRLPAFARALVGPLPRTKTALTPRRRRRRAARAARVPRALIPVQNERHRARLRGDGRARGRRESEK